MMLRPVRGQQELAAEGVQFLGLLEERLATHSHRAHFSVLLSSPGCYSLFLLTGGFFVCFSSFL